MSFARAQRIADAVLYEGYVLYPYRASSRKNHNQVRWQFGVLLPRDACDGSDGEHSWMQTECLALRGDRLIVKVRWLQLQRRSTAGTPPWDEAVEQSVDVETALAVEDERVIPFAAPGGREVDGDTVRERAHVRGEIFLRVEPHGRFTKVRVRIDNVTPWARGTVARDEVMPCALVSAHTLLEAPGGAFVSHLDPPDDLKAAIEGCANVRTWPVLAGPDGDREVILSSPIILYDHPQVAPESKGDFYDGCEIDEILTLRTMTLTDEEKAEARATDPRAAGIIDRVEAMTAEDMERLHGTRRDLGMTDQKPEPTIEIGGVKIARGSSVRLHPRPRRADAQDMFIDGRVATVRTVLHDVDGHSHVAVTLDDDPASDLYEAQGRYLYFDPEEIEPLLQRGPRILVAGVGNIFLGDDGFGVEVARRLGYQSWPEGVRVADFGIRGMHLAYQLLDGYDAVILIDAMARGKRPGTLTVLEPDVDVDSTAGPADAHSLDPAAVLSMVKALGGTVGRVAVVGCEPADIDEKMELSEPVSAAIEPAVRLVREIVAAEMARLQPKEESPC